MKNFLLTLFVFCIFCSIIMCSSSPDTPDATPEVADATPVPVQAGDEFDTSGIAVSIEALSDGLSPNGDGSKDKIAFSITADQSDKIASWKLGMKHGSTGKINKEFSGTNAPPESLGWEGDGTGGIALEGKYTALLSVSYKGASKPVQAESETFILDITPPELKFKINPVPFSPDGDGINDTVTFSFTVNDTSPISSWNIIIYDEDKKRFHRFAGSGKPDDVIEWNGINTDGHVVEIARDYTAELTVTDIMGNASTIDLVLPVDILVVKVSENKYKIKIGDIIFDANKSNFKDIKKDIVDSNMFSIGQLRRVMKKYEQYTILIEGHAMMPKYLLNDKKKADAYNRDFLIPLTKQRAEAVKQALVEAGIDGDHIITEGLGASEPLYSHNDMKNRWKNRRVEFYLVK